MKWKPYLLIMCIFILGFLIVFLIGTSFVNKLEVTNPKIETTEDVYNFLIECEKKPFLDCEELLKRKIGG